MGRPATGRTAQRTIAADLRAGLDVLRALLRAFYSYRTGELQDVEPG